MSIKSITSALFGSTTLAVALVSVLAGSPAQATVNQPDCEAVESWAFEIDPKDRWYLDSARKRHWLPSAFQSKNFETLFGKKATAWSLDDVAGIKGLLQNCSTKAQKAQRFDARKSLTAARGFVSGSLKNFLVQTERSSQKIETALESLLTMEDSPELLRTLALLRKIEVDNKDVLDKLQHQIWAIGSNEAKAARQIVFEAPGLKPGAFAAGPAPRIEARFQELHATYPNETEGQLASASSDQQSPASLGSKTKTAKKRGAKTTASSPPANKTARKASGKTARSNAAKAGHSAIQNVTPTVDGKLHHPDCDKLHEWAAGYNAMDKWKITPSVWFPNIARDQFVVPLFGTPVMEWSEDEFGELNEMMIQCSRQAARRYDSAVDETLRQANGAMGKQLLQLVNLTNKAPGEMTSAISALTSAPDSQYLVTALTMADKALKGKKLRSQSLRNLPQEMQLSLNAIERPLRFLPQKEVEQFTAQIANRKAELEKSLPTQDDLVASAIKELNQFEIKVPRDLGGLYEHGQNLRKQLEGVDVLKKMTFENDFRKRLEQAAPRFLPAFRKALAAIPTNQQGVSQLRTAIEDFTGIADRLPELEHYRTAAAARALAIAADLRKAGVQ